MISLILIYNSYHYQVYYYCFNCLLSMQTHIFILSIQLYYLNLIYLIVIAVVLITSISILTYFCLVKYFLFLLLMSIFVHVVFSSSFSAFLRFSFVLLICSLNVRSIRSRSLPYLLIIIIFCICPCFCLVFRFSNAFLLFDLAIISSYLFILSNSASIAPFVNQFP